MNSYPSHAISEHLVLSELLTALMQVGGGNTGGQVGHLILPPPPFWTIDGSKRESLANQQNPEHVEEWHISASLRQAQGTAKRAEGEVVFSNIPVNSSQQLCVGIVLDVIESKEPIVLDDATHNGEFTNDPYILRTQAKSLLCMPLVNGEHLRGLLYLENNLTTDAFTADRVSVLNLLSAQAAISIENARWINALEEKVASYTDQLKQEIIERKRAEEAAHAASRVKRAFLANMNHELRTPLHAILGYTEIVKLEHPQDKRLETIERSGQHLLTLIEDLLDIAFEKLPAQGLILRRHDSTNSLVESESKISSFIIPPKKPLTELQKYAEIGDMMAIRERASQLREQNQAFEPFANQLEEFAEEYQMPKIRQWITKLLDGKE